MKTEMKQDKPEVTSDSVIESLGSEKIIELDVHDLQPPEPMMKILENLERIDETSVMVINHHREPHLLYPILEERGYRATCIKIGEDKYRILIRKKIG